MQVRFSKFRFVLAFTMLVLSVGESVGATEYVRDYGPHSGYVSSVADEKSDDGIEIPFINKPADTTVPIKDRIFNSEISKEFKTRYEDQFGRTEAERVYNSPNKDTYYDDLYTMNGTPQQVDDQKRAFGNYMAARLVEYHFDKYMKSDPSVRTIYEAKERLSKVNVEVDQVKFDAKYELAGNTLDLRANAPWFSTQFTLSPSQRIVSLTRMQSSTMGLEARYLMLDQKVAAIINKRLTKALALSFTASGCTGDSTISQRETLYLGGLSLAF